MKTIEKKCEDNIINITKKELLNRAEYHKYVGFKLTNNAFYFDWKQDFKMGFVGFKYGVAANTKNCTKKELFDILYNWLTKGEQPPYYVWYKYAENDQKRFKVPLSLKI